ncbi:MAG TPA: hypothetical protein VK601_27530 [Kofleriaceae bacterium]|nr:hypothetical protein [Kofleriaceae bacterium]
MCAGLLVVFAASCGSSDGDDGGGGGGDDPGDDHPAFLVGGWDHDEGREGYANYADYSIGFDATGSYDWQFGPDLIRGRWQLRGAQLLLDGTSHPFAVAKNCRVVTLDGKTYLGNTATPVGCPTVPAPLSALDKCAVGEFTTGTANGGTFWFRLADDRTIIEFWDDPGYTSGGSSYTRVGEFSIDTSSGDITMTTPDGKHEARTSVKDLVSRTRKGAVETGCDMDAFRRLGGGGGGSSCPLTCEAGRVCAEDDGFQACCPTGFPSWCRDLNVCFASASQRDAACANAYYGNPAASCEAGQDSLSITGVSGAFCSPTCSGTGASCPSAYNGKAGTCALFTGGSASPNRCALTCSDIGVKGGQCLPAMTCRAASNGAGFCVY